MTDNGCKREMTFEEERLAFNARLKELLFAEDEYPGDSLLKSILRDSQRILGKATAEIGTLHMNIINRQSEYVTLNQYYEHTKELLEIEKKELKETQEKLEVLLCEVTGGKLSKHSYTAEVMTREAHERLLKCCEDERTAAVKEFAKELKLEFPIETMNYSGIGSLYSAEGIHSKIDKIKKERVGES